MKKIILLTVLLFGCITQKGNAQSTTYSNTYATGDYLGYNGAGNALIFTTTTGLSNPQMTLTTGGDLNINNALNGYQINNAQMLYTGGDPTSVFAGGQIPLLGAYTLTAGYNTFLGLKTYNALVGGSYNTVVGALAGKDLVGPIGGAENTLVGTQTGTVLIDGQIETFYGYQAGYNETHGQLNTFIGAQAGYENVGTYGGGPGDWNTFTGFGCGYNNTGVTGGGFGNDYYGKEAGYNNEYGYRNCMFGAHAGYGFPGLYSADSDSFFGHFCAYNIQFGNSSVVMGCGAAYNTGKSSGDAFDKNVFIGAMSGQVNPGGDHNIVIGYGADAYDANCCPPNAGPIYNSVAIGAQALVFDNDKFIIGNNEQDVGIGMSGLLGGGPQNKLEISVYSNIIGPTPCANPLINSTFNDASCGTGTPTGESGLQFRDLTYASVPFQNNPNSGFLTVDDVGNVVLMQQGAGGGGPGIGYCNALTSMADDGGYNLNNHNFYFAGNASTQLNQNNVYIGYNCQNPPAVVAKLDVLQNSLAQPASNTQPSIGAYIENDDLENMGETSSYPVIGVKSYVPNTDAGTCTSIAGWFEAPQNNNCSYNYGIIVPKTEGGVALETQLHEELWMWREVCIMKVKPKFRLRVEELL